VQEILETQEKSNSKSHIWTFRTPEEASYYWKELYGHLDDEPEWWIKLQINVIYCLLILPNVMIMKKRLL